MALTDRAAEAIGGPRGGTTWYEDGPVWTLQNHAAISATTSLNELVMGVGPYPNTYTQPGVTYQDVLASDNVIQGIYGVQFIATAFLAAQSTLSFLINLRRSLSGGLGQAFNNGTAYTSLTLANALVTALPSGQVITVTNSSGNQQNVTLSAAAAAGATSISINSVNPANSYASGSPMTLLVGNSGFAGWSNGASGTPIFYPFVPIRVPFLTANLSLQPPQLGGSTSATFNGGFMYYQPGDTITVSLQTSSGSVSVPVSTVATTVI